MYCRLWRIRPSRLNYSTDHALTRNAPTIPSLTQGTQLFRVKQVIAGRLLPGRLLQFLLLYADLALTLVRSLPIRGLTSHYYHGESYECWQA
jgi:hypothetical protein